jgi:hypothetical protein
MRGLTDHYYCILLHRLRMRACWLQRKKDALDKSSHLSTLPSLSLKEKLRKAGLPVRRNKAELFERL